MVIIAVENRNAPVVSLPDNELERIPFIITLCQNAIDDNDQTRMTAILTDKQIAHYLQSKQLRGLRDALRLAEGTERRKSRRLARQAQREFFDMAIQQCRARTTDDVFDDKKLGSYHAIDPKQSTGDRNGANSDEWGDRSRRRELSE